MKYIAKMEKHVKYGSDNVLARVISFVLVINTRVVNSDRNMRFKTQTIVYQVSPNLDNSDTIRNQRPSRNHSCKTLLFGNVLKLVKN